MSSLPTNRMSHPENQDQLTSLFRVIADLRQPQHAGLFLRDFLSPSELSALAKRLTIAVLLEKGSSYQEIKAQLGVSSATISNVSDIMNTEGVMLALKILKTDHKVEQVLKKWLG